MKAVVMNEYGGPEVLKFTDYPEPSPGPGMACCH
jgi:NADPH:quinone reductase-like Zn-dependent oxidoreductase